MDAAGEILREIVGETPSDARGRDSGLRRVP